MLPVWPARCYSVQSGWLWFTTPAKLAQQCLPAFQRVHTQPVQVAGALLGVRGTVSRPRKLLTHGPSGTKHHPEVLCSEPGSGCKVQFTQCQAVLILSNHGYNLCVSCKLHHSGFYPGHGLKQNNTTLNSVRQHSIPVESLRKRIA